MKKIFCQINKCLACRSCELACAVIQSESKNLDSALSEEPLPKRFIRVEVIDEKGKIHPVRSIALQCRHCEDPQCIQACITGGMYKDEKTGNIIIQHEKCVGCWSCIMVCPFGGVTKDQKHHEAFKCNHCEGRDIPACVEACPTKALIYCEQEEIKVEEIV